MTPDRKQMILKAVSDNPSISLSKLAKQFDIHKSRIHVILASSGFSYNKSTKSWENSSRSALNEIIKPTPFVLDKKKDLISKSEVESLELGDERRKRSPFDSTSKQDLLSKLYHYDRKKEKLEGYEFTEVLSVRIDASVRKKFDNFCKDENVRPSSLFCGLFLMFLETYNSLPDDHT